MPSATIASVCSPLKAIRPNEVATHIAALQLEGSLSRAKKKSFIVDPVNLWRILPYRNVITY